MTQGAPVGNKFWMLRSSHGVKPFFATPQDLWDAACEYFEWVDTNPLVEDKPFSTKDDGIVHTQVSKMRAMTLDGMYIFLDISRRTWTDYTKREAFIEVCERIDSVIRSQKFAGAAAGLLNPVIIARDLGLVEKNESTTTINKGSGWDEIFARVGNKSRSLTKSAEPLTIEHDPIIRERIN